MDDEFGELFGSSVSSSAAIRAPAVVSVAPAQARAGVRNIAPQGNQNEDVLFEELFGVEAPKARPQMLPRPAPAALPAMAQQPMPATAPLPGPRPPPGPPPPAALPLPPPARPAGPAAHTWVRPAAAPPPNATSNAEDEFELFLDSTKQPDTSHATPAQTPAPAAAAPRPPQPTPPAQPPPHSSVPGLSAAAPSVPLPRPPPLPPPPLAQQALVPGLGAVAPGLLPGMLPKVPGPRPPSEPPPPGLNVRPTPPGPRPPPPGPGMPGFRPQVRPAFNSHIDKAMYEHLRAQAVFPSEATANPQALIKLPQQARVTPEEYKEFLELGHGGIFDLDLDRLLEHPWRNAGNWDEYFNYGLTEGQWRQYQQRVKRYREEFQYHTPIPVLDPDEQGEGSILPPEVRAALRAEFGEEEGEEEAARAAEQLQQRWRKVAPRIDPEVVIELLKPEQDMQVVVNAEYDLPGVPGQPLALAQLSQIVASSAGPKPPKSPIGKEKSGARPPNQNVPVAKPPQDMLHHSLIASLVMPNVPTPPLAPMLPNTMLNPSMAAAAAMMPGIMPDQSQAFAAGGLNPLAMPPINMDANASLMPSIVASDASIPMPPIMDTGTPLLDMPSIHQPGQLALPPIHPPEPSHGLPSIHHELQHTMPSIIPSGGQQAALDMPSIMAMPSIHASSEPQQLTQQVESRYEQQRHDRTDRAAKQTMDSDRWVMSGGDLDMSFMDDGLDHEPANAQGNSQAGLYDVLSILNPGFNAMAGDGDDDLGLNQTPSGVHRLSRDGGSRELGRRDSRDDRSSRPDRRPPAPAERPPPNLMATDRWGRPLSGPVQDAPPRFKRSRSESTEPAAGRGGRDADHFARDAQRLREWEGGRERDGTRDRNGPRDRDRDRENDRDKDRDKDRGRDGERERERTRDREFEVEHDRGRDREDGKRDRGRELERDRGRGESDWDYGHERDRDKGRDRDGEGDRGKGKKRDRSRDRDRDSKKTKDKDRDRDRKRDK